MWRNPTGTAPRRPRTRPEARMDDHRRRWQTAVGRTGRCCSRGPARASTWPPRSSSRRSAASARWSASATRSPRRSARLRTTPRRHRRCNPQRPPASRGTQAGGSVACERTGLPRLCPRPRRRSGSTGSRCDARNWQSSASGWRGAGAASRRPPRCRTQRTARSAAGSGRRPRTRGSRRSCTCAPRRDTAASLPRRSGSRTQQPPLIGRTTAKGRASAATDGARCPAECEGSTFATTGRPHERTRTAPSSRARL
mmetsp:Transcript_107469/g.346805  ORF Transcript_107469/g.346805 Transcript_107469/m.346805 type:complete len:254 (-) Transcript_107469:55-816(-)